MPPRADGPKNSTGMPPGTKLYSSFPFAGMNTQASPVAISDQEFLWCENFIKLGDGNYRTAWDHGAALYKASGSLTIISFYSYTIATSYFFVVFLSDGSAVQVSWPAAVVTQIGPAGTFYNPATGYIPACTQWGVLYLLISNRNTPNDYWVWDGALLYAKGTAAPNGVNILSGGSNYNTSPPIEIYGGFGSGITVNTTVNDGSVVEINITNPGSGYEVGDIPQIAFQGGGSDRSAILTAGVAATGVAAVNVTAGGSGYTSATVSFTGGGGTGAAGTVLIGSGVSGVTVSAPGSGYTGANVTFTGGGGTGAAAIATVNGGQLVDITITSPGAGYVSAPTVIITGDGTGAGATAQIQGNSVIGVEITAPGSGYTTAPAVAFGGPGTGASGTAQLNTNGGVASVTVVDPGTGFSLPPLLTFLGGGAPSSPATAVTTLTPTTLQFVNVLSSGSLYSVPSGNLPTLQVFGGAVNGGVPTPATVAISAFSGGSISAVSVTSGGAGYVIEPFINVKQFINSKGVSDEGSGATFEPVLTPVPLGKVIISNQGNNYSSAPTVLVTPGANHSAYATISLMPFGLSGSAMETFQSRVWIADPAQGQFSTLPPQGDFSVTAPESVTDVATSDGGLIFTNSDRFLQTTYVGIRQSNGYLYFFGDGSVSVASSVQTTGNPPTTTFNYQTVDPQVGCAWRDSIQDFGRTILFGNTTGVYGVFGGSTQKVSAKLDGVFRAASFPPTVAALTPTTASAHLFNIKHYLMLMTVFDPDLGESRNVMITWNEKDWYITSQSIPLTCIATQKVASQLFAWGTDGTSLYPLFAAPSADLTKRIDTKLFGANSPIVEKDLNGIYIQAQDQSVGQVGVDVSVSFALSGIAVQVDNFPSVPSGVYTQANYPAPAGQRYLLYEQPNFPADPPGWPVFGSGTGGLPFMNIGARLSTTSPDFSLGNLLLAYTEGPALA